MNPKQDPSAQFVQLEMGYGADEFGKVLNGTFSSDASGYRCREIERHHWAIEIGAGSFELTIKVAEQPPRQIALLSLPVLDVRFHFGDTPEAAREQFFHRFHQYFHKGGG